MKEKGPPANTNTGGSPTVKKVCVSKGGSDHSNAGDDSASTASADLSMLEMKMASKKFEACRCTYFAYLRKEDCIVANHIDHSQLKSSLPCSQFYLSSLICIF